MTTKNKTYKVSDIIKALMVAGYDCPNSTLNGYYVKDGVLMHESHMSIMHGFAHRTMAQLRDICGGLTAKHMVMLVTKQAKDKTKGKLHPHVISVKIIPFSSIGFGTRQAEYAVEVAEELGHSWGGNSRTLMSADRFCDTLESRGRLLKIAKAIQASGAEYIDLEN